MLFTEPTVVQIVIDTLTFSSDSLSLEQVYTQFLYLFSSFFQTCWFQEKRLQKDQATATKVFEKLKDLKKLSEFELNTLHRDVYRLGPFFLAQEAPDPDSTISKTRSASELKFFTTISDQNCWKHWKIWRKI